MADNAILLGQIADASGGSADTALVTVPALTNTVVSSVVVCNRASTATTFRIAANDGGAASVTKDWLYYDVTLPANDTFIATIGVTLETGDTIRVTAGAATVTFNAFGIESA